jgi:hypothetical protein
VTKHYGKYRGTVINNIDPMQMGRIQAQVDPDYPIWSGCFWGSAAEVPALALATPPPFQTIVLQTLGQNTLMISDMPGPTGGILLKSTTGALISVNEIGITISNGQGATIVMAGPSVTVNAGALVVI